MKRIGTAAWLFAAMTTTAVAQEPQGAPVPVEVKELAGCWDGSGSVLGKPVVVALNARSITEGALFLVDVDSHALEDAKDRYSAHLLFGGKTARTGDPGVTRISAFYADSFGGDFTAVGTGAVQPGGFDVTYAYPDADFINHWMVAGDTLSWAIVAKAGAGPEEPFAAYSLVRAACAASGTAETQ